MDELFEALKDVRYKNGSYLETFDRERPYNGQPHTDQGERGKQEVSNVTMRDLHDAAIRGFFPCLWTSAAVIQCMTCEIEKMMGIYPNVPQLHYKHQL